MNIENLKCFILVAENLSFSRAAEALYISQPAVTKQINTLEEELGVALFIRSTRYVKLTPAGMSFYKDAKDIVQKSQLAVSRLQKQNTDFDSISIGLSSNIALFYLSPLLKKYYAAYPDVRPHIEVYGYKIILNLFLENKLDLLFYYTDNMSRKTSVQYQELEKDHMSCLLPAGHPLAAKEKIMPEDLTEENIIACNPLNAPLSIASFQQKLLQQHPVEKIIYCDSIETAHCMAASGMGISILPNLLTMKLPDFVAIPFDDETKLSFGVFYHKRRTNAAVDHFLKLMI